MNFTAIFNDESDEESDSTSEFDELTLVIHGQTKECVTKAKQEIEEQCQKAVINEELRGSNYEIITKLTNEKVTFTRIPY